MATSAPERSRRWTSSVAWTLCAISVGMAIGAILFAAADPTGEAQRAEMVQHVVIVLVILALPYGIAGGVVASRRPHNPLGWIFLAVGLLQASNVFMGGYAHYGVFWHPGSLPGATLAQWVWSWTWFPALALIGTLALLLFPDGRPLTRRWRWVVRAELVTLAALVPAWMASAWPVRGRIIEDEFGVRLAEAAEGSPFEIVVAAGIAATGLIALLSVLSVVLRYRRARGIERQQMKWFAFAGAIAVTGLLGLFVGHAVFELLAPGSVLPGWVEPAIASTLVSLPVAAGIAILRYRLFEIDRVIRRTVSYAVLTVLLVAAYAGLVIVLQPLLGPFTSGSDLAVAASTLAVAALFGPLRRRIQRGVDRRFDRAHYDAGRIVEVFAQRLRDEVDVDALASDLAGVARTTVRPRTASVWLTAPTVDGSDLATV
jgi:hypothetical protein